MIKEKDVLEQLDHRNIMKIIEAKLDAQWVDENGQDQSGDYIASEVVMNGELFDFIDNRHGRFSEPVAKHLFLQMLAGMTYMHHRGFANRDIKLENMLIGDDFKIKLAAFGFAKPMEGQGDGKLETFLGTPGYMAPEILEGQ